MLAEKYRPKTFDEIIGQERIIKAMQWYLDAQNTSGHCFLITGPSGSGKTALGHCAARYWGVDPFDVQKIQSATCTAERLEDLANSAFIYGRGRAGRKCYLIDEIHTITGRAKDRLLSVLEDLPAHVLIVGTTTETDWTDGTLISRFVRFDVAKVKSDVVARHLERIAQAERLPIPDDAKWAEKFVKYAPVGLNVRDLINQLPKYLLFAEAA